MLKIAIFLKDSLNFISGANFALLYQKLRFYGKIRENFRIFLHL
jgi:hypothetical protein